MSATGYPRNRDSRGRHRGRIQNCRDCKRPMFWVTMNSGKRNALNLEQHEGDPVADVLVIERRRGGPDGERWIIGVTLQDLNLVDEARQLAFELHSSHFADERCPGNAARIARRASQHGEAA
jgi:hypothetical protein